MPVKRINKKRKWNSRIKKRRKQTLYFNARVKKSALGIGILAVLLAAGWFGYQKVMATLVNSQRCLLTEVEIKNLKYLPQHEILRLANIPSGVNIFALPLKEIETRIETNPLVKKAQIDRKWPSALIINIQEREPLAKIIDQEQEYLLDNEIKAIKNPLSYSIPLPVLSGLSLQDARLPGLMKFLFVLRKQGLGIFQQTVSFTMDTAKGLIMQLSSGLTLYWGDPDTGKVMENMRRLKMVQDDLDSKGISLQYIDLRFKNVVVKPL